MPEFPIVDLSDEDDEGEPLDDLVRAKGTMDGARTLAEAAQMARDLAEYLQGLHDSGHLLREPVRDDYAWYYKPGG